MGFRVHLPDGEGFEDYVFHGDATYEIDNGVLTVRDNEGNKTTYSPSAWWRVEERPGDYDVLDSVR
ncbi:MAG TPA: hypothetical protein VIQ02_01105 [Jiangellaceae bacterium]